jgi:hypothetical protein
MAIYCDPSCAPPVIANAVPALGCKPVLRSSAFKRLAFFSCAIDPALLLPTTGEGAVTAADIIDNIAVLYAAGVNSQAFVSPEGIRTGLEQTDPLKVKLSDCGTNAYVNGALTLTMEFKYGWNGTPVAVSPAVDENPEDAFWQTIADNFNSWNYGFVDCNGVLGYMMNETKTAFATGTISVKDVDEEINDCLKITKKQVVLTFECGAKFVKIATLTDPDFDELITWA